MNECLADMKKILDAKNQHFFLIFGTLLGQQRNNDFISYDNDVDIGILFENYDDKIVDYICNSGYFRLASKLGKPDKSLELKFRHKNNMDIDIFIFYPISPEYYYCASFLGLCNKKPEGYCKWGFHIRGFDEIIFKNHKYNIPKNSHEFLTEHYGNWKIPDKYTYFEGLAGKYKNMIN